MSPRSRPLFGQKRDKVERMNAWPTDRQTDRQTGRCIQCEVAEWKDESVPVFNEHMAGSSALTTFQVESFKTFLN